jgi:beta-phosphoglucomutase
MVIKTILFDLDGVLTDTSDIQFESQYEAVLNYCGINIRTDAKYNDIFSSTITTRDKLYYLVDDNIIQESDVEKIYTKKKKNANKFFQKLDLDNDKIDLFKYLKEQNLNIGIVTNGNKISANIILDRIGISSYIDLLIANDDCNYHKPFSEPYIRAMLYFGNNLNEYLILEDSYAGLTSARNTGSNVYFVKRVVDINIQLLQNLIYEFNN